MSVGVQSVEVHTGDTVPYAVREREVEHPRLTLNPDGTLDVIAPEGTHTTSLVASQLDWITEEYKRQLKQLDQIRTKFGNLVDDFTLWGSSYQLRERNGQYQIHVDGDVVTVSTPSGRSMRSYLANQLKRAIKIAVQSLADIYCERIGVEFESISIRRQRTKWASCSAGSKLNFNIRCGFLPIRHLKYLVVHEVAHLKHQDHSDDFWSMVGSIIPKYTDLRRQLQGFWYAVHRNSTWQSIISE
ncbi:M48 family metallopeptidase [Halorubrum distributum]|uniref:M48 family metallopeptidase n=1 Tax=Halorubrum distributum TaxID=29283 RepID=UPI0023A93445|nr:SprT family zinc-dependent metalloprotease [Halorubrum arcis]